MKNDLKRWYNNKNATNEGENENIVKNNLGVNMLKKIIAGIGKWNVKKSLVVMFLTIIVMSFIGYLSLVVVYTIPVDGRMNHNIQSSAEKFLKEGSYVGPSGRGSTLDNFTDALMVLSAGEKTKNGIMVI